MKKNWFVLILIFLTKKKVTGTGENILNIQLAGSCPIIEAYQRLAFKRTMMTG